MAATFEIVVLGGNIGGISAVHYLLRHTVPLLERVNATRDYHITLVTPNTHLFFKIGCPRALISPTLLPEAKILRPLSEAFKTYNAKQFQLIQGIATALDPASRVVTVVSGTDLTASDAVATYQVHYDCLIISTGTTTSSALWTLHHEQSLTSKALTSMHETLPEVRTVLIAGGGPVGVETSGEIASAYPKCKITLLSGSARLLPRIKPETSARAQNYLEHKKGVEIIHNLRAIRSESTDEGSTIVSLTNGSTKKVDLYIDATGGKPNSQFLPVSWLDESGRVVVRDEYFRVRGSNTGSDDVTGVYVLGDIVAGSANTMMELDSMVPVLCASVAVDIAGAGPKRGVFGRLTRQVLGRTEGLPVQKDFKPMKNTIVVPIGTDGGVGQLLGWNLPGWFVKIAKGKSYLVELVDPMLSGSKWK